MRRVEDTKRNHCRNQQASMMNQWSPALTSIFSGTPVATTRANYSIRLHLRQIFPSYNPFFFSFVVCCGSNSMRTLLSPRPTPTSLSLLLLKGRRSGSRIVVMFIATGGAVQVAKPRTSNQQEAIEPS